MLEEVVGATIMGDKLTIIDLKLIIVNKVYVRDKNFILIHYTVLHELLLPPPPIHL